MRPDLSDVDRVWEAFETGHTRTREFLEYTTRLNDRTVRQAIHELICERHKPIVCPGKGYKVATTAAEVDAEIERLRHRAGELHERADGLVKAKAQMQAEQLALDVGIFQ